MKRNHKQRKGTGKKAISIIVDGKTEIWYLQMMKEHESLKSIYIKPELPTKKKLEELFEYVIVNSKDYSQVIWIIDFDTILKEERESKVGSKSKITELKEYLSKIEHVKNISVLVNTPCLEYWYLQHLKDSGRYYDNCNEVCKEFKNTILKDYEKTERYYKRKNADIYKTLKPYQKHAIQNSKKLGNFNIDMPKQGKAELYKIFDLLSIS
jgi:hypothetical protein